MSSLDSSGMQKLLERERATFYREHAHCPRSQIDRLWSEHSSGWKTVIDNSPGPQHPNHIDDPIGGICGVPAPHTWTQLNGLPISRSRTEFPPVDFFESTELDNSPYFGKKRAFSSSRTELRQKPAGKITLGHIGNQNHSLESDSETETGPQKIQKTMPRKHTLPLVLESEVFEAQNCHMTGGETSHDARLASGLNKNSCHLSSSFSECRSDALIFQGSASVPNHSRMRLEGCLQPGEQASQKMCRQDSLNGALNNVMHKMSLGAAQHGPVAGTDGFQTLNSANRHGFDLNQDSKPELSYEKVKEEDYVYRVGHATSNLSTRIMPLISMKEDPRMPGGQNGSCSAIEKPALLKRQSLTADTTDHVPSERALRPREHTDDRPANPHTENGAAEELRRNGDKVAIPKATSIRPTRQKIKCPQCNERPEGFKGDHELRRHIERSHSEVRRVWICVNGYGAQDPNFLNNCKHCREKKAYGAYYNAAAHLRRVHFNPRPKGARARGAQPQPSRAGNGGGNFPPMDYLRSFMKEVEEIVVSDELEEEAVSNEDDDDPQSDASEPCALPPPPPPPLNTHDAVGVGVAAQAQEGQYAFSEMQPYSAYPDAEEFFPEGAAIPQGHEGGKAFDFKNEEGFGGGMFNMDMGLPEFPDEYGFIERVCG